MTQTIEIPEELIKEANRFGMDAATLARRALRRLARELAAAEHVVIRRCEEEAGE